MATAADLKILRAHYDPPPDLDALLKQTRTTPGPAPTAARLRRPAALSAD
ncbi:hypothetical protein ACH4TV_32130 [Streptomyces sp. NPDC020898]